MNLQFFDTAVALFPFDSHSKEKSRREIHVFLSPIKDLFILYSEFDGILVLS